MKNFQREVSTILSQTGRKKPEDMTMIEKVHEASREALVILDKSGKLGRHALSNWCADNEAIAIDIAQILIALARIGEVFDLDFDRLQKVAAKHLAEEYGIEVIL